MSIQEEQAAKMKAEKIRVALEKIKEAQVKKVNVFCFFFNTPEGLIRRHETPPTFYNTHRLVIFAFLLKGKATKRRENRSLQRLAVEARSLSLHLETMQRFPLSSTVTSANVWPDNWSPLIH